jgi:excisionase family DNA binding protein
MLWTVKRAAQYLGMEQYRVYYLLMMGEIESAKIGNVWRLSPEGVKEYDKRFPERNNRKASGNFIYPGNGGFLFGSIPDSVPFDKNRKVAGVERRRGKLVHSAKRHNNILLEKFKSVKQFELFVS